MPYPSTFDVRQDQFPNLFNGNEIHSSTNEVEELQTARSYNVVKAACAFYFWIHFFFKGMEDQADNNPSVSLIIML